MPADVDPRATLIRAAWPTERIVCGTSHPVPAVERRFVALRTNEGHPATVGCGGSLVWAYAYRCVQCGGFFHRDCILRHFEESRHDAA